MFFLGLLIGAGIYFVAYLIWSKSGKIRWAAIVSIAIDIALWRVSLSLGGGALVAFVAIVGIGYFVNKNKDGEEKSTEQTQPKKSDYKSHCWNCGNPIDGSWNRKCPDCNEFYICPHCGACKCDYGKNPPFEH